MTREEAINIMNVIVHMLEEKYDTDRVEEAVDMAIKALSADSCEDCISRAELLKAVDTWDKFGCDADTKLVPFKDCYVPYIHYDDVVKAIKGMPSIQPKPNTGHWILVSERLPKEDGCYLVTADLVVGKSRVEISSFAKNLYSVDEYEFFNKKGKSGWYNYDDDYGYWVNEEVIAWMPLPEPYKAESEEV